MKNFNSGTPSRKQRRALKSLAKRGKSLHEKKAAADHAVRLLEEAKAEVLALDVANMTVADYNARRTAIENRLRPALAKIGITRPKLTPVEVSE